ncbi:MAG: GNAT family N-acetyltransferase [Chloroflexota bacterium]
MCTIATWGQAIIQTKHCILRPLQSDDLACIVALYTNAAVRQFLGGVVTRSEIEARFITMMQEKPDALFWVIKHQAEQECMGLVSLTKHHNGVDTEVSYQILPKYWRQGYASEVVQAVVNYGFDTLKLPRIVAETQAANVASRRLLARLNFHQIDTVKRFGAEQVIYATLDVGTVC